MLPYACRATTSDGWPHLPDVVRIAGQNDDTIRWLDRAFAAGDDVVPEPLPSTPVLLDAVAPQVLQQPPHDVADRDRTVLARPRRR